MKANAGIDALLDMMAAANPLARRSDLREALLLGYGMAVPDLPPEPDLEMLAAEDPAVRRLIAGLDGGDGWIDEVPFAEGFYGTGPSDPWREAGPTLH